MKPTHALLAVVAFTPEACSTPETEPSLRAQSQAIAGALCPNSWYDAQPPNPSWSPLVDIVPIRYNDSDEVLGLFPAPIDVLQSQLPPSVYPLPIAEGVGMLAVGFFDYRDIEGINPYRELDLSILVADGPSLADGYSPFFVSDLLLNSNEAIWAGIQGWGYNKVAGNPVCSRVGPNGIKCTAISDDKLVLRMEVHATGPEVPGQPSSLLLLSTKDNLLVRTAFEETLVRDDATFSASYTATLELGDSPIAARYSTLGTTSLTAIVGRHLHIELPRGFCAPL